MWALLKSFLEASHKLTPELLPTAQGPASAWRGTENSCLRAPAQGHHPKCCTKRRAGVSNPRDLMPGDQRWSWRNNNRNKVHDKWECARIILKPFLNPWSVEKLSTTKSVPGAKKVGDRWRRASPPESGSSPGPCLNRSHPHRSEHWVDIFRKSVWRGHQHLGLPGTHPRPL